MKPNHHFLSLLTREQVKQLAPDSILLMVTAATEQHGPHLPLGTDTYIGEAVARSTMEHLESDTQLVLAPVLPFGSSHHHLPFGALSIETGNYLAALNDLLETAITTGFRRIFVINSHGGNADCLRLAGRDRALATSAVIGTANYWDLSRTAIQEASSGQPPQIPGHAGHIETSIMLALQPESVDLQSLPADRSITTLEAQQTDSKGALIHAHGEWTRIDGYTDVPNRPTAEFGHTLLTVIGRRVAAAVSEFAEISGRRLMEMA